jgi:hypothetical protein
MLTYSALADAPPAAAWSLLARPARWHEWAPQLRGAWGLGDPEVRAGARGAARLLGVVPVPARIVSVDRGRSWVWQVGPVRFDHRVEPARDGRSEVAVDICAARPLEALLAVTYGPVVQLLVDNLARVAARAQGGRG